MKRKFLSLMLNLTILPYGFLYLKDKKRFWTFYSLVFFIKLLTAFSIFLIYNFISGKIALTFIPIFLLIWFTIIIWETLKSERNKFETKTFNKYFIIFVIVFHIIIFSITDFVSNKILSSKVILSSSMEPNFNINDSIYFTELFRKSELKPGDIVSFKDSNGALLISRIIAIPHDEIILSYKNIDSNFNVLTLTTNGIKLNSSRTEVKSVNDTEEYTQIFIQEIDSKKNIKIKESNLSYQLAKDEEEFNLKISENRYFLISDNRDDSIDSRILGPISSENIIGKFAFTHLAFNPNTPLICSSNDSTFCYLKKILTGISYINLENMGYDNK